MAVLKLESSTPNGGLTDAKPSQPVGVPANQNVPAAGLGTILDVRKEIDDVLADMTNFHMAEPDVVMQAVSAHGARLTEIIVRIQRIEVVRREWKPVREEADRVLSELKSQFSIASRLIAIRQMDFDLARGQV